MCVVRKVNGAREQKYSAETCPILLSTIHPEFHMNYFGIKLSLHFESLSFGTILLLMGLMAQAVSRWLPTAAVRVRSGSAQVGFVVGKVAVGQDFSEYFGFTSQFSFHQLLHNHLHLSSGAGTIGQKWQQYKRLSPTPLAIKRNPTLICGGNYVDL
jgi:hypothetical protein